jgi:hypothetical protein
MESVVGSASILYNWAANKSGALIKSNSMTSHECKRYFWFSHHHIQMLVSKLGFLDIIILPNHRDCVMAIEAFCFLLCTLSYPNNWFDFKDNFGCHPSSMSRIFTTWCIFCCSDLKHHL